MRALQTFKLLSNDLTVEIIALRHQQQTQAAHSDNSGAALETAELDAKPSIAVTS
jgi:hypothetical protein